MDVTFSRRLAIIGGVLLPVLETARRWPEWPGPPRDWIPWIDDYVLGIVLLGAAWLSVHRGVGLQAHPRVHRHSWLTAGWGFVSGCGFGSTLAQLHGILHPELSHPEPSRLAHGWIVLAKAFLVAIGLLGLFASTRPERPGGVT
jgi:hypothetical protein